MTDYPPVDVSKLVDHVIGDSSSDYDDGLGGYSTGTFDASTGVLTLKYERDEELQDAALNEKYGYVYESAEYRFQLIPTTKENEA